MSTNQVHDIYRLSVVATHPTTPLSGQPVRCGDLTGVAITDESDGGNPSGSTSVDFGPGVWSMIVSGVDGSGASNVALYDKLYYVDATAPRLSKDTGGKLFGYAMETVVSATSGTIKVLKAMP